MSDPDTKAVLTVRTTVLVTGIVVAASRIAGPALFHPALLEVGVAFLLVSIVSGIFTHTESNLFLGPNRASLRNLARNDVAASDWDEDSVIRLAERIDDNHGDIERNGRLLFVTRVGSALGVIAVVGAAAF